MRKTNRFKLWLLHRWHLRKKATLYKKLFKLIYWCKSLNKVQIPVPTKDKVLSMTTRLQRAHWVRTCCSRKSKKLMVKARWWTADAVYLWTITLLSRGFSWLEDLARERQLPWLQLVRTWPSLVSKYLLCRKLPPLSWRVVPWLSPQHSLATKVCSSRRLWCRLK